MDNRTRFDLQSPSGNKFSPSIGFQTNNSPSKLGQSPQIGLNQPKIGFGPRPTNNPNTKLQGSLISPSAGTQATAAAQQQQQGFDLRSSPVGFRGQPFGGAKRQTQFQPAPSDTDLYNKQNLKSPHAGAFEPAKARGGGNTIDVTQQMRPKGYNTVNNVGLDPNSNINQILCLYAVCVDHDLP
jgi:hypothetical protein